MTRASLSLLGAATIGLTALGACSIPVDAQTASQVARDSSAPPVIRRRAEGGLAIGPGAGQAVPRGAERLTVAPGGLVAEGGLPDMAAAKPDADSLTKMRAGKAGGIAFTDAAGRNLAATPAVDRRPVGFTRKEAGDGFG